MSIDQDICARFAQESERHRARLAQLLRPGGPPPLAAVRTEVRTWITEAVQLGVPELAATLGTLNGVVQDLGDGRGLEDVGPVLTEWADRVSEIASAIAAQPGYRHLSLAIQTLRSEMTAHRASLHATTGGAPAAPTAVPPPAGRQARRILVCDDSPVIGELMAHELRSRGHEVCLTSNHADFTNQLDVFDPELVFLDIQMPEASGDEVCQRLRSQMNPVPVIFISSLPDAELARLAQAAGADGYLSKQHGMEEICAYLEAMLAQLLF